MKKREIIFDYIEQIFKIFGVVVLCMCIFCVLLGERAKEFSTIFALGESGLTINTILQFFLLSVIIITLRLVFFTEGLIKKLPVAVRTVCMFILVILFITLFSILFGWFPVNMWQAWLSFFVCFFVSAGISTALALLKEKVENKRMEEALRRLKEGEQ